ncbi:MAG: THUMP domain-containing protein [Crocinitomicaceae bacterium]|nr:THUMP domain-containing protein [Crocinitomicaceae bacterium]
MEQLTITIKTIFGVEEVLKEELNELGYNEVTVLNRAVQIQGTMSDVYYLNLHLRCAMSVLVEVKKFKIRDEQDLFKQCMKIDWTSYFDISKTFAVKGAIQSTLFTHTKFPFLLVKDAIVDTFRDKLGERPNVNIKTPQVVFDLYIKESQVTISLNTSGAPLYQRGYRTEVGEAPLNEVTAAALIRLSKWDRKSTFMDPFCGSGTLLIEAALLASGIPSNIDRQHYAFKNFIGFDSAMWEKIQSEAIKTCKGFDFEILGSDMDSDMMMMAKRNLRGLPIGRFVNVTSNAFQDVKKPSDHGTIVCNPPYGERMGDGIEEMYQELGDWFKNELKGWNCWVISSNEEGFKSVGLKPTTKVKLFNGDLECSFREFRIFDGFRKDFLKGQNEDSDSIEENEETQA